MQGIILKFAAWLAQKLIGAVLIVVVALAAYGLWLFVQEEGRLETERVAKLQQTVVNRERLLEAGAVVERKIAEFRTSIAAEQARLRQAEKVLATLRELESWWDRWFGNRSQQTANVEQQQRMEALKGDAGGRLAKLNAELTRLVGEKGGLDHALQRANHEVALLEASRSRARHYVVLAWDALKWYVALALAAFFFGPTLWSLALYHGLAPLLARGAPIRLGPDPVALPAVGESRVSVEAELRPGDVVRLKEDFLQASDEGVERRTRFVLDWSIPFTSLACGLVELVELSHQQAGGSYRVTLSSNDDPHAELAVMTLPPGSSLVLRPRFLAGVILGQGQRLEIRRHWRIFRWQAWITGQFRFFEFVGPCRLVVTGSRGLRVEQLDDRAEQPTPARRTNQDATIGFTPNLDYRPVRAETFWSYYRGMNPLFDDLFAGRGLFVVQEISTEGSAAKAAAFWSSIWSGVLKVFGL
jgi:hypothetical protein